MSLDQCIPGMVERGEISDAQAERMRSLYGVLHQDFRRQFGDQAASAMASDATLKALRAEALLAKRRTLLQMRAQASARAARATWRGKAGDPRWAPALLDRDGHAPYSNVEGRRKAIERRAHAQMDVLLSKFRRDLAGRVRNRTLLDDVVREAFGEDTGNLSAREIARGWTGAAEMLRGRFNAAGGDIGKLDRWGLPQAHDSDKVRAAGYQEWRDFVAPLLDRNRMIDSRTLRPFSDEALELALNQVYQTIGSDGWAKRTPGAGGRGMLAASRAEGRFLIFKSADDWMTYNGRFGRGGAFEAMMRHVANMSRDTAAMEILGPNPDATIRWLRDTVEKDAAVGDGDREAARRSADKVSELWDEYTGANRAPGRKWLADMGSAVRSFETASKLGSAMISAVPGDVATQAMTARFNALPFTKLMVNLLKTLNPASEGDRLLAIRMGLGAEGWSRANAASMRTFNSEMSREVASRLAEGVLRVSGMGHWTDGGRWANGLTLFGHMADVADRPWSKLDAGFQRMLDRYGIGEGHWDAIRSTPLRQERGAHWLFPEDITDQRLADRVLEMAATEQDLAVPVADLETRAMLHKIQSGTVLGETVKNSLLFKSFGIAMLLTHGRRIMQMSSWRDRISYTMGAAISLTLAGALSIQLRHIIKGNDPQPMDHKFWLAALLQGGGFGMIGDLTSLVSNPRMASIAKYIAGPVADTGQSLLELGSDTAKKVAGDRETSRKANPGRKLVNLLQTEVPGGNLFYTRLAYQRLFLDRLSEAVDPHYRSSWRRLEKTAREGQSPYYWRPGQTLPDRAPDIGSIAQPTR